MNTHSICIQAYINIFRRDDSEKNNQQIIANRAILLTFSYY